MTRAPFRRRVRIEMELRVTYPDDPGSLTKILKTVREAGGAILAHLAYRIRNKAVGLILCEKPTEAALALRNEGWTVETETAVTVRTENRPGALSHLVRSLEAEKVGIGYTYAAPTGDDLLLVISTDDNPRAEDILRAYLRVEEPGEMALPE